jgi:hypothetical protein
MAIPGASIAQIQARFAGNPTGRQGKIKIGT